MGMLVYAIARLEQLGAPATRTGRDIVKVQLLYNVHKITLLINPIYLFLCF